MKIYILIFGLSFFSCFSQREIGELKNGKAIFTVDTVKLKDYFGKNLYKKPGAKVFQKIEIRNKKILFTEKNYYCLLLSNFKRDTKTSKWLELKDGKLYLINNLEQEDLFESTIQTCEGKENNTPNVIELDGKRNWTCGELVKCSSPEEAKKHPLKSSKSIIEENF